MKPCYKNCTAIAKSEWALPYDRFVCSNWENRLWENHVLWWDLIQGMVVEYLEASFHSALRSSWKHPESERDMFCSHWIEPTIGKSVKNSLKICHIEITHYYALWGGAVCNNYSNVTKSNSTVMRCFQRFTEEFQAGKRKIKCLSSADLKFIQAKIPGFKKLISYLVLS